MNSAVRPIFNENFAEKGFVGSVNSARDLLEKHKSHRNALLTNKKKKKQTQTQTQTQTQYFSTLSKRILSGRKYMGKSEHSFISIPLKP